MIYVVNINDKAYEVEVEKGKASIVKTTTQTAPAPQAAVQVQSPAPQSPAPQAAGNGEPIKAPMPGAILDIKANIGAKVKKGQLLFILEAMKMENEIFASIDGVVSQIMVSKGSNVSTNDILMVIQ
ncbi:MAG: biotin/lipoyl-containing protein [Sedimentibacter sp.]|uniref:biotin/lipoyl-containing protein n=1 Tax=Sedimentibacter sp. TaxID=1960295 RepID=UPI0031589EAE